MSGNLGTLVVKLALELKEYRSKLQEAARDTQQAMGEAGRATEGLDTQTQNLGQTAGTTAKQLGQMAEAVAQGDYAGAAQKMGQMATQATAVGAGVSAMAVGVGTAVVALAAYAVIAQKASEEQARQANVMALTGNAAGLLTGQMNEMARAVASNTQSAVGSSREIVEGLASTGRVGRIALEDMATAVELVAQATGKSRDSVVGDFEGMADGVAKWAAKHNETYHFLTFEQYQYIKALEDAGRAQEAMQVTSEALRRHLAGVPDNLGILQRAWRALGNTASWAWDKMLDLGRAQTTADKLTDVSNQVAYARQKLENAKSKGFSAGVIEKAQQELDLALRTQTALQQQAEGERQAADAKAASAKASQDKIDADKRMERTAESTASAQDRLAKALKQVADDGQLLGWSDQKILDMQNQVRAAMETRTSSTKKLTEAEREAIELRNVLNRLNSQDAGVDASFYKDLDTLYKAYSKGGMGVEEYRLAVEKLINSQRFARDAAKADQKATEDAQKAREKAVATLIKERDAYIGGLEKSAQAVETQIERLADEEKAATLAANKNISLAKAVQEVAIARLEEKKAQSMGSDDEAVAAIQREIDARRQLLNLIDSKESREANQRAADENAKYWDKTWEQVSQSLTDELMRGGKSGKEYIEGIFRTMVLRPGLQWGIQSGMNALGLGGSPTGGSGLMGTFNNLSSLYNTGSTVAGWLGLGAAATGTGLAATAGTGMALASTAGTGLGLTAGAGTGLSLAGAGTGLGLSATAGTGTALTAGASAGAAGGAGIMSSIGAAMPYVAAFVAVASLLKGLDDSGTFHTGGAGSAGPAGLRQGVTAESLGMSDTVVSAVTNQAMETTATSIASMFNSLGRGDFNVSTAFADDTSKDGAWGALRIERNGEKVVDWNDTRTGRWAPKEFADGEKGSTQYAAALAASTREALLAMDLPGWADSVLESLGDAPSLEQLGAAVQEISQTEAALANLGSALPWLASMSDETATGLLQLSGGIGNFAAAHQAYYDAMYSDAEKLADTRARMATALDEQGLAMPTSIAAWRELTKAQDRNTEAGREAYLTLIQLGPTFAAQMQSMLDQAGIGADSMASVIRDGLLGRLSAEDAGGQVAAMIVDGIYNAMANSASAMVTDILMQGIVQPMVMAASTGAAVTAAVSQATIDATVSQARVALQAIGAVLNDPAVQAMLSEIGSQTSALFAGYQAPNLSAYQPQSQPYQNQNTTAANNAEDAWTRAYSALERAVAAQRQAAEEQLQAATAIYDLARSNARDLRGEVDAGLQMSAAAGREFISEALANLQATGYLPDQDALGEAIAAARAGLDGKTYTNAFEFNRDRLILAGQLQAIADQTEPQMTAAEQQLEYLEGVLDTAQEQLDALKGIDNSVLSVAAALQAWQQAAGQSSAGSGVNASSSSVRYTNALDLRARAFDVGTDYVPTDMLALIHQGEQIVPKAYNPHANGQGGRTEALLQTLVDETRRLQQRMAAIEIATSRTSSTLDDAARGRITLKTEVVP